MILYITYIRYLFGGELGKGGKRMEDGEEGSCGGGPVPSLTYPGHNLPAGKRLPGAGDFIRTSKYSKRERERRSIQSQDV